MKLSTRTTAPLLVLAGALLASTALVVARPAPEPLPADETLPLVEVVAARPEPAVMLVRAHGTVEPRTQSDLVAEVGGRIVWMAPGFEAGGSFAANEVLARIEPRDHEAARERARAAVERAESQLALAKATLARREKLLGSGVLSPAAREEAEASEKVAEANLRDARAQLVQAELSLERTALRAPFPGQVRERRISLGEVVAPGTAVAALFATDYAEVRLPIASDDLAFLDLASLAASPPEVVLRGEWLGQEKRWRGRLVRAESVLDPQTRMLHVVARLEAGEEGTLPIGLFVSAEVSGRRYDGVTPLPRAALRPSGDVALVDADGRLRLRRVEVLRAEGERVYVASGLAAGERVCVTPLAAVVEGMPVRVAGAKS
jgi:RND family efflux transporter MFP subunit